MNSFEIEKYVTRIDLLTETLEQIKKDFGEAGIGVSFSGNTDTAFAELRNQICPYIENLLNKNYGALMQILYRIDIPETMFKNILSSANTNAPLALTEIIIKRELQKVVIRNFFKKNASEKQPDT